MDNFLKLLKFGLQNRAAIFSVWALIFGAVTGGYMATQKPVERVSRPLPIPERPNVITPPAPPKEVRTIVVKDTEACKKLIDKHVRKYHFGAE